MPIDVTCPTCGAVLPAPDELAGKKIRCADCEALVAVPLANASPPPFANEEPLSPPRPRDQDERPVAVPRPEHKWEEPLTPPGQKPNVLTGGAMAWLFFLAIFSLGGLAVLALALMPLKA
jgi:hypothetical protein